ncbi:hypothetical protein GCM10023260_06900 [Bartonella acomydis]|uniref:Surface protein/Bartonella adhesin n=1 Tax=Bartonella acomydis TaxID=686234 RepID=A0ABP9MIJ0_9HYPH
MVRNSSGADVPYPFGSHGSIVFAGDDDYCGVDNVKDRGNSSKTGTEITAAQEFENFILDQADNNGGTPYGTTTKKVTWVREGVLTQNGAYMGTATGGDQNILPQAYGVYSFVTGCGAAATGNYSTAFGAGATTKAGGAQAFGVAALASGRASVAMGVSSEASGLSAVAIGGLATASGSRSIAIGVDANAKASGSIAIGSRRSDRTAESSPTREVLAEAKNAIAIGTHTYAKGEDSVAIGANAQVLVQDGVAVGGASVSRREKGDKGYDPATGQETKKTDMTWKSTAGAFSVGDTDGEITRQITGVAAGTKDTDAVNVAQLKAINVAASGAWKLSANDTDPSDVNSGNTVDFSVKNSKVGKDNLKIEKNTENIKHKIEFALNDQLELTKVTTGQSTMSDDGFFVNGQNNSRMTVDGFFINDNGPSMTVDGIDAGNQKIINVAEGTKDTDAVNYKQLREVKDASTIRWQLSVNGGNGVSIGQNNTVNLQSAGKEGSQNIKIVGDNDRNVTFDLADDINVMSVTAGESVMSAVGFAFKDGDGPSITVTGIHAGNKTIKGVAAGEEDTDAVNYKQLTEVKTLAEKGWKLSVDGDNATDIKAGDTVDLIADETRGGNGKKNIEIKKVENNKVTFALKDQITLESVVTGNSIMNKDGFTFINGGPKITASGIEADNKKITKVAAGEEDTDAVNYKQLKDFTAGMETGWKLSVEDEKATDVGAGSTVKFVGVPSEVNNKNTNNIKITKGENNEVKFALNDIIRVKRVITGKSSISDNGFVITDGPNMTTGGINAGNKTITGVANGEKDTDAVNVAQLNEIKGQIAGNSIVKWDEDKKLITIGKEKGGTKINIANSNGENRVIAGVADGNLRKDSHDAINGSQIDKISGDIAKFFGGGATFENGEFSGPSYVLSKVSTNGTVERKEFNNVGEALRELDGNVKNVNSRITYFSDDFNQKFDHLSQDALLWSETEGAFVARHKKGDETTNSKITYLLNGDITEDSTDAINGSQIHSIGSDIANFFGGNASFEGGVFTGPRYNLSDVGVDGKVKQKEHNDVGSALTGLDTNIKNVNQNLINSMNDVANYFGGGAGYDENGEWHVPTFHVYHIEDNGTVSKRPHQNVAAAFEDVNNTFTNIHNQISDITKNSLVKWEEEQKLITIGKDKAGTEINIAGFGKVARKISGVKAAEKGDEAVNKDQLDKSIEKISKDIETASVAAVLYDKDEDGSVNYGSVTLGGDKNNGSVALLNVKDGKISKDSHDAVNGSQINKISGDIANYFGGGASFENGAFKGPKYSLSVILEDGTVGKVNHYDVGSALTGLDANVKSVNSRLTNVTNNFNQKIEGISKDALLWDEEEQAFIARHEKDGQKTNSKLKYLLDGDISKDSTDAINGSQLYSMGDKIAAYFGGGAKYENGKWTAPNFKIIQVNADGTTVEKNHNNVADAFGDVNKNMSNINNRIDDVINKVDSDALKWNKDKKAYDAGRDGQPNKIINVADGDISEGSRDAVNGGQLWKTNERISGVEKDVKHISNRVDNISNTIADIGDIVTNIDAKVDNIDNRINNIAEDAVRYDRDENGKKINKITLKGGDPSEPVMIDNVADGRIEKDSKEAINGGQLHDYTKEQMKIVLDESKHYTDQRVNNIVIDAIDDAVERANNYTNMKFEALNYSIENVRKEARQAAAIGLAVANLRYNDTPGKLSVGFGSGLWRNQSAFAFGAGYTSERGNIRSNVSVTTSGGHWGVGAGFNMTLN